MWHHFVNLLGHSWDNMMRATGTTTLGFWVWTFAATLFGWLAAVAYKWFELRRGKTSQAFWSALVDSAWAGIFTTTFFILLVAISFGAFLIRTVYGLHQALAASNQRLIVSNANLSTELETRKHSISTTDPVFPNIIYMLQAFNIYRHVLVGAACRIKVTAPPTSAEMASMIAQFSNSVSGCNTFGPLDFRMNPDVEMETVKGMDRDLLVFHAARGDKAADQLFLALGNQIQMRRSYEIPRGSPKHFVWLQFGTNTKWNSEMNLVNGTVQLSRNEYGPSPVGNPPIRSHWHFFAEYLDRILALIAIVIASIAMLDVRRLFEELEARDRHTEERIHNAVLKELLTHAASFAAFYRAAQFITFFPEQPDKDTAIALLTTFRTQQLLAPDAKPEELAQLRQETREQIEKESAAWAQLIIDSGIGELKDGWKINKEPV
jgi:hypothetical protein